MKKLFAFAIVVIVLTAIVAACGSSAAPVTPASALPAQPTAAQQPAVLPPRRAINNGATTNDCRVAAYYGAGRVQRSPAELAQMA